MDTLLHTNQLVLKEDCHTEHTLQQVMNVRRKKAIQYLSIDHHQIGIKELSSIKIMNSYGDVLGIETSMQMFLYIAS